MDLSEVAIGRDLESSEQANIARLRFIQGDVTYEEDVATVLQMARSSLEGTSSLVVYSRFFLHSLDDAQERMFLQSLSKNMISGDALYFEFRCLEDSNKAKIFGNHYRRYVDTDQLKALLIEKFGFSIDYCYTGCGMAKYREEDPVVSRVIAKKR